MTGEVSPQASCVQYCSSSSGWSCARSPSCVHVHLCWALSSQVNTSTYLRPCTLLPAFLLSCRAGPPSLMFFWLGRGKKVEEWKEEDSVTWRAMTWRKDKDGSRTHCHNMTYPRRCYKDCRAPTSYHKLVFMPLHVGQAGCSFAFKVR